MRTIVVVPRVSVRVETWFGVVTEMYIRIPNGDWIGDAGQKAGPELSGRFENLGKRAEIVIKQERLENERSPHLASLELPEGEE